MMNQYEVPAYLVAALPEIKGDFKNITPTPHIFKSIQCLSEFTRNKVMQHDWPGVKRSFAIAEYIYTKGNTAVRDAIENVFVFSFSSLLHMGNKNERLELRRLMPVSLHTAYVQQVLKSGI